MDKEETKTYIENTSLANIPELKSLRDQINAGLEQSYQRMKTENENLDNVLTRWDSFEKDKESKGELSQIEAIWLAYAKLSKYTLKREQFANKVHFIDEKLMKNLGYVLVASIQLLKKETMTKEQAEALVGALVTQLFGELKEEIIDRENQTKSKWIGEKFNGTNGSPPTPPPSEE